MKSSYSIVSILIWSALPNLANAVLPTPVVHYSFDDIFDTDSATTATESVGGLDATWSNSTTTPDWDVGILGGSARFHGGTGPLDDNYFETPRLRPLEGDTMRRGFSISVWINPDSNGQHNNNATGFSGIVTTRSATVGTDHDSYLGINLERSQVPGSQPVVFETHIDGRNSLGVPSASLAIDSPAGSISFDDSVGPLDGWYHVVYATENADFVTTFTNNSWIYINGQLAAVNDFGGSIAASLSNAGTWLIGSDPFQNERILDGRIDDLAFYDSVLSASDVAEVFNLATINGINAIGSTTYPSPPPTTFEAILENYHETVSTQREGDLNFDGIVDAKDFRLFREHSGGSSLAQGIPEPNSITMLVFAFLLSGVGVRWMQGETIR